MDEGGKVGGAAEIHIGGDLIVGPGNGDKLDGRGGYFRTSSRVAQCPPVFRGNTLQSPVRASPKPKTGKQPVEVKGDSVLPRIEIT